MIEVIDLINSAEKLYSLYGYPLSFLASFIEISPAGFLIPGGLILAIGGFFSYSTDLSLLGVLILSWLGSWSTFLLAYYLGSTTGYYLVSLFKQEKNLERAKMLFKKRGGAILTTSLIANLTRFWVAYVAGVQKYNFPRFLFYSALASLTWSSIMTVLGYIAGSERANLESTLAKLGLLGWLLVIIATFVIYRTNKIVVEEIRKDEEGT
jgi:membrane protein DedA with SNARE-associated domain